MSFEPSPKQAFFLFRMMTGETPDVREPAAGQAKPSLSPVAQHRQPLIDNDFIRMEKRGRSQHLVLQPRAWEWAARSDQIELMKSRSSDGAEALQGLLRRLIPFLQAHDLSLREILSGDGDAEKNNSEAEGDDAAEAGTRPGLAPPPRTSSSGSRENVDVAYHPPSHLSDRIRKACLFLAGGKSRERVRLTLLRSRLGDVTREELDEALITMQRAGDLVIYRDDNSAGLSHDDHEAALHVGDEPRHLVYLEN